MSETQQGTPRPTIIAILYLASFLVGITAIIGVVLAYVWKDEAHADWESSHYQYLIRTFWIGLLYSAIATILVVALIGILLYAVVAIWFIVRCAKSLSAAGSRSPIADPTSWLF
ncbi:DUF4870 family protein [Sandaracinobacteroides saxicola]|uniref:DUF4870 domain-containing protein n=1 Tax=Sandaracinobacteroides saxicola TaxID=2759707 RepID=A0A7G5IGQ9_9SPHN|nr:hypothetical protein [Sandaracinobacteroides saxicola]QMW22551.1 hypothetical protein H3309_14695 [Sandaracinobacteroides saxicola]